MTIPLNKINGMPAFSTYFPKPPALYKGVKSHQVHFKADKNAIDRVLPSCFEPSDDALCIASGMTISWCSNYGQFEESTLSVKCKYKNQEGYFCVIAFLNSKSSIPAGREIYGTPKVFASINVGMDERIMYTNTVIANQSIMNIRSSMEKKIEVNQLPQTDHSWRLKVIPGAEKNTIDVMQLIDGKNVQSDQKFHTIQSAKGVVEFNQMPIYDLSDFTPKEYYGAYYIDTDFTENNAEVIHDFLKS